MLFGFVFGSCLSVILMLILGGLMKRYTDNDIENLYIISQKGGLKMRKKEVGDFLQKLTPREMKRLSEVISPQSRPTKWKLFCDLFK